MCTLTLALVAALAFAGCNNAEPAGQSQPAGSLASATPGGTAPAQPGLETSPDGQGSKVTLLRVPNGGIQPQALADARGTLHLIYFQGEPAAGDLFYVRREPGQERFSDPLRVNSRPGSAIAIGTVRGGQLALGKGGRIHVAWNASGKVGPDGMLYTRSNDSGTAFEPERNLLQHTSVMDGGGTVAADEAGHVYVAWHALQAGSERGEAHRRVWVARSADEGKTFSGEAAAWAEPTGVCPCCSTRALDGRDGSVYVLYRSATADVNRDIYLLTSTDHGQRFKGARVHRWKVPG
jgi:hypothetical protein